MLPSLEANSGLKCITPGVPRRDHSAQDDGIAVIAMVLTGSKDRMECLNDRERAVAVASAHGASPGDIASWLGIAVPEVCFHLERACHKLGVGADELRFRLRRFACAA